MAKIFVHRAHQLIHAKAKAAAEELAQDLERKFGLCYAWTGDHIEFNRPGVTGRLRVGRGEIELDVELGWLLSGFRGSIEQEIHRQLDAVLEPRDAKAGRSAAKVPATARTEKLHASPVDPDGGSRRMATKAPGTPGASRSANASKGKGANRSRKA